MSDWFFKERRDQLINWMSIDLWIHSSLASTWQGLQERYNAASSFFARFRLSGWKRVANELGSEALTLGAGGFVLMYALALPAFLEIDENKALNTGKYAVKFLDRNGREIGQRGILHNDAISLEDIPDHMIKATLATEDRRFFEHFGIDPLGTGARCWRTRARAKRCRAARASPSRSPRTCSCRRSARSSARSRSCSCRSGWSRASPSARS